MNFFDFISMYESSARDYNIDSLLPDTTPVGMGNLSKRIGGEDCLNTIISNINVEDMDNIKFVSKKFHNLANNENVWKIFAHNLNIKVDGMSGKSIRDQVKIHFPNIKHKTIKVDQSLTFKANQYIRDLADAVTYFACDVISRSRDNVLNFAGDVTYFASDVISRSRDNVLNLAGDVTYAACKLIRIN